METCFNYCNPDKAFFSSDERRWINRIHKLAQEHPDDVKIIREPEQNDGCIYCQLPVRYMHIYAPSKHELSDEERKVCAERLRRNRQNIG